jgi:hypothetical protein
MSSECVDDPLFRQRYRFARKSGSQLGGIRLGASACWVRAAATARADDRAVCRVMA